MELISTHVCKGSDIGVHNNMFGGAMMALIDEASAAYACQICDTPRMVTIKIDELVFKKPVKIGNVVKIYGEVKEFGNTSVTLYVEVRKHSVYNGKQDVVTHTNIKFVRIDEEGNPIPVGEKGRRRIQELVEKKKWINKKI